MIVADPMLTPVTVTGTEGVVAPPAMNTLEGEMVALLASLVANVTATPPTGAGVPSVTVSGAVAPSGTEIAESEMADGAATVTATAFSRIDGNAEARTVVDPTPTPVTGIATLIWLA